MDRAVPVERADIRRDEFLRPSGREALGMYDLLRQHRDHRDGLLRIALEALVVAHTREEHTCDGARFHLPYHPEHFLARAELEATVFVVKISDDGAFHGRISHREISGCERSEVPRIFNMRHYAVQKTQRAGTVVLGLQRNERISPVVPRP